MQDENEVNDDDIDMDTDVAAVAPRDFTAVLPQVNSPVLDDQMQQPQGLLKFDISKTPLVLLMTFSYLPGNVIYHKIALLDRKIRRLLNQSFLLDQEIVITQRVPEDSGQSSTTAIQRRANQVPLT